MDETALRELLDSALTREPPMGPVARNSLQAGIRIRRRSRALGAAGSAAAVAVIAVAIPAATGVPGNRAAVPVAGIPPGPVVYAVNKISGTVTPIETATGVPGRPISVGFRPRVIAITPDGKTAYVINQGGTVTPIATATGRLGKPIKVGGAPYGIAITPDGETAYVANLGSDTVTPIATATNQPGEPIKLAREPGRSRSRRTGRPSMSLTRKRAR
jgi:YVTN family beta-propeller protein